MSLLSVVVIAVGLAMDAFAVAVATSIALDRMTGRHVFRFAFHFGLFQALMPILGWLAGRTVVDWIGSWDHWVGFGLLSLIGGKAIYEALTSTEEAALDATRDPTRGWSLVLLSVATSIDALAVGLSLACLQVRIWVPVALIGLITAAITAAGMFLGRTVGARFGQRASILGGLVLIGIGVKILIEHLGA